MEITIKSGTKGTVVIVLDAQERRGWSQTAGSGASAKRKAFSFDDYRAALEGVGPKTRENILTRAEQDENIEFPDFVRLCRLAYPEAP